MTTLCLETHFASSHPVMWKWRPLPLMTSYYFFRVTFNIFLGLLLPFSMNNVSCVPNQILCGIFVLDRSTGLCSFYTDLWPPPPFPPTSSLALPPLPPPPPPPPSLPTPAATSIYYLSGSFPFCYKAFQGLGLGKNTKPYLLIIGFPGMLVSTRGENGRLWT